MTKIDMYIIEVSYTSGMSAGEIILHVLKCALIGGLIGFACSIVFWFFNKIWNWLKRLFD